jgi:hypothetical protein
MGSRTSQAFYSGTEKNRIKIIFLSNSFIKGERFFVLIFYYKGELSALNVSNVLSE